MFWKDFETQKRQLCCPEVQTFYCLNEIEPADLRSGRFGNKTPPPFPKRDFWARGDPLWLEGGGVLFQTSVIPGQNYGISWNFMNFKVFMIL